MDPTRRASSPTSAERWSRGFGHITTRQNMQFHFVPLKDVPELLDRRRRPA